MPDLVTALVLPPLWSPLLLLATAPLALGSSLDSIAVSTTFRPDVGDHIGTVAKDTTIVDFVLTTENGYMDRSYWFRHLFATELSAPEVECMQNGTVLHSRSGRCEWLYEQGPCDAREWLVLDAEGAGKGAQQGLRAACRPRPCAPGYGFLADERRCAPQRELCTGEFQRAFRYSLRGEGRCYCKGFRAQGPDGKCHAVFHEDSCSEGQMLYPRYNRTSGGRDGICAPSPCPEGEVILDEVVDGGGGGVVGVPGDNKNCSVFYELDCSAQMAPLLSMETDLQIPLCDYSQRTIFIAPRRLDNATSCLRNHRGRCLEVAILSSKPYDWISYEQLNGAFRTTSDFVLLRLSMCVVLFVFLV